jgi:hypothetical protein
VLELILIKTKKGNYLKKQGWETYHNEWYSYLLFNAADPVPAFKKGWIFLDEELSEIGEYISQPNINYRYELIDTSMVSDKLKMVFQKDDITFEDENGCVVFKEEYKPYRSLYEYKYDKQPNVYQKVDFKIVKTLEFDELVNVKGFSYPVKCRGRRDNSIVNLTKENVTYDLLTELCVPDIARDSFPVSLTSNQSYNIVRKHIQDNIDSKYAKITSDYDFCFTVKKKIEITILEKYTYDANLFHNMFSKRKRRPKIKTGYRSHREIEVFEMTHSDSRYKGYTVIEGFKADSLIELKNVIDKYLKELMDVINEPIKDCPHCEGKGVVFKSYKDKT